MINTKQRSTEGFWKRNKDILSLAIAVAAILLVPLVAMQFSDEVAWTLSDFIIAAILLFGTGLVYVLGARRIATTSGRIKLAAVVGAILILVWAELAVGLFGTPWAGS